VRVETDSATVWQDPCSLLAAPLYRAEEPASLLLPGRLALDCRSPARKHHRQWIGYRTSPYRVHLKRSLCLTTLVSRAHTDLRLVLVGEARAPPSTS
jgi:hypothetical protein